MKKYIPNTITSLNLLSGCIATVMAFNGEYLWAMIWVMAASIFDFLDGFAARMLKVHSPMGKELDSLADMISFGLAPAMVVFRFLSDYVHIITSNVLLLEYLPYMAFLLVIFSALRLAKFNIDERQSDSFIGLNTPANALFWISFCYGIVTRVPVISASLIYIVLVAIVIFSLLLTSELPMFSLKIKSLRLKGNEYRYFLAVFVIGMIIYLGFLGIAAGVLLYIALSILNSRNQKEESENK